MPKDYYAFYQKFIETQMFNDYRNRIKDIAVADFFEPINYVSEEEYDYGLPF